MVGCRARSRSLSCQGDRKPLAKRRGIERPVKPNRSIPSATVIPVLVYPDVRQAVAWLNAAFGFAERTRIGESHRAQISVGKDGAVIVADARGEQQPPQEGVVTHVMKVRVEDVEAWYERARTHGALVLSHPPTGSTASGNAPSKTWPATAGSSPRLCETWRPRNTAARLSRPGPNGDQIANPEHRLTWVRELSGYLLSSHGRSRSGMSECSRQQARRIVMQPGCASRSDSGRLLAAVVRSAGVGWVLENPPSRRRFWRVAEAVLGSGGACAEDDGGCAVCGAGRGS